MAGAWGPFPRRNVSSGLETSRMRRFFIFLAMVAQLGLAVPANETTVPVVPPGKIDQTLQDQKALFLDVRDDEEVKETGSLEGYKHIPLGDLKQRLAELPKDSKILVGCEGGFRAAKAAKILQAEGFQIIGSCALHEYKGKRTFPKP